MQLQDHFVADDKFTDTLTALLELTSRAHELFLISEPAQQNKIMRFVFSNLVLNGKKIEYTMNKPFDLMAKLP
jgi:site-specific DNA recombinase